LSRLFGQHFIVENRGGAADALGVEAVVKSPADGYTFLSTPSLRRYCAASAQGAIDPLKDFVPVTQFVERTLLLAVHPSVNSIQELAAYAKQIPANRAVAHPASARTAIRSVNLFKAHAGVDILHVPYRGTGESMPDFLADVVHIQSDPATLPHIVAGKAKLLAVLARERRPNFPNVLLLQEIISGHRFPGVVRHICPTQDAAIDCRGHELRDE
jgi:tripartite-type tricarboxylate transporter receptor subunit TctC